jgi:hypothetical protein
MRAASVPALSAEFRKSGLVSRHRSVRCAGRDFLWFWTDEGSGVYLIHGFLYSVARDGVRLVLEVPPEQHRVALDAEADNQKIAIQERTKQSPREPKNIAVYYPVP